MYEELLQLNNKMKTQFKRWANDVNRHFPKEVIQITNKHMKRGSTSFIIRDTQIKTTVKYHFTPTKMVVCEN